MFKFIILIQIKIRRPTKIKVITVTKIITITKIITKLRTTCFLSGLLMTIYFQVSCLFSLFVLADCPEPVRAR